ELEIERPIIEVHQLRFAGPRCSGREKAESRETEQNESGRHASSCAACVPLPGARGHLFEKPEAHPNESRCSTCGTRSTPNVVGGRQAARPNFDAFFNARRGPPASQLRSGRPPCRCKRAEGINAGGGARKASRGTSGSDPSTASAPGYGGRG